MSSNVIRKIIKSQIFLSKAFDRILPEKYRIVGNTDFKYSIAPKYLRPNLRVYDIGAGKNPLISFEKKSDLKLVVVALDISLNELNHAPQGVYDETICADITLYRGTENADLVICQAFLEHVKNVDEAFAGIRSILQIGGKALIFVPSRNAIYARLNLILPEKIKNKLLDALYANSREYRGFASYYDRCTPKDFREIAKRHGLVVVEEKIYFFSSYFSFFFPLYLIWRFWQLAFHLVSGEQAAESFSMVFKKEGRDV